MSGNTGTATQIRREQGFDIYVLQNARLELAVVPELGARIVSLKDLRTGREWMWRPEGGLRLFRNRRGDDFSQSTLAGADECLPTIAPCEWRGRQLPDHGELWSAPWTVDPAAWRGGVLKTSITLAVSPFHFTRAITVSGDAIRMDYRLGSQSTMTEHFLWALHPLLRLEADDCLRLPASTRALLNGAAWPDAVGSAIPPGGCAKVFAGPVVEGFAAVHNPRTGEQLAFEWDPAQNNTLGLWLTRGGWHGHHHFALEPSNGSPDPLARAAEANCCGVVPPLGSVSWSLCLRVGP